MDDYKTIGRLLRTSREERYVSLDQASKALHIRARYLQALEEGNFPELPGVAYTKGYLQSYAAYLQLDKEEMLRRFELVEEMLAKQGFYLPEVFSKEKNPAPVILWGSMVTAVLLYMLWVVVLAPYYEPPSVVEPFNLTSQPPDVDFVAPANDGSCLNAQFPLYPPCYWEKQQNSNLLPLRRRLTTVMELAQ